MEGISKERRIEEISRISDHGIREALLKDLLCLCTELDPWLPIDENTPKDRELILLSNDQKFIGEWCSQHVRWEDNCGCEIYPERYKLLSPMPPTEQPDSGPKAPGTEISPDVVQ